MKNQILIREKKSRHKLLILQLAGLPTVVKIVEVGPRDGLQNEPVSCYPCFSFIRHYILLWCMYKFVKSVEVLFIGFMSSVFYLMVHVYILLN